MANVNRVFLLGNLTRDPELRYAPSGTAVTTFGIAVNHIYTAQNGERKKEVDFFRICVFGKIGENCAKFLNKGKPVFVEGRLRFRQWDAPDGQKKSMVEVIANNIQFLGTGGKPGGNDDFEGAEMEAESNAAPTNAAPSNSVPPIDDVPF